MAEGVNLSKMGMGSGLNTQKLIQQQLKAESKDLQGLQKDSQEAQQRRKLIQQLKGKVDELRNSVGGLTDKDAFQPRSASTSNKDVVQVEAKGTGAVPGTHSVEVQQLARSHHHLVGVSRSASATRVPGEEAAEKDPAPEGSVPNPTRQTFPAQQADIQSGTYTLTLNGTEVLTQEEPGRLSPQALVKAINEHSDATGVEARALDDGRVRLWQPDGEAIDIRESLPDGQGVTYFGKSLVEGSASQTVPAPEQPSEPEEPEPDKSAEDQPSLRPAPEQGLRGVADADSAEWINSGVSLSFHHAGSSYSYTTDDKTTLKGLAEKITQDSNGVVATAVNRNTEDNPHYILSLKSESVGAGEQRITADGDPRNPGVRIRPAGSGNGEGGQSADGPATLFRNPDHGPLATAQEQAQEGSDARFTVDGTHYTRSTNEFSDVIDGVRLSLQGPTPEDGTATEVAVSHDVQSATKNVQELVKKYNALASFIDKQTSYNKEQDKAGPLHGSSAVRNVESRMRSILSQPIGGGEAGEEPDFRTLSEVGVRFQRNGQLSLDNGRFTEALQSKPDAVAQLFAGDNGLARNLDEALHGLTRAGDGTLTRKVDAIGDRIERLQTDMREEKQDLQEREKDLKQRYAELEKTISKFQGQKAQMNQAMAKLPGG
jgi:flagellar capping protein FliD